MVGALIGLFTAGPLSDAIAARLTKRNRGIREPEMRLVTMIPFVIIMVIGNVVVAVGYERAWDWKVRQKSKSGEEYSQGIGHRPDRLHLRRDPSCCSSRHFIYILDRLVQTSCRIDLRCNYGQ